MEDLPSLSFFHPYYANLHFKSSLNLSLLKPLEETFNQIGFYKFRIGQNTAQ